MVQIDSDARENKQAVDEIEAWAFENGFSRTDEYYLRRIIKSDGRQIFRGICYRITPEIQNSAHESVKQVAERAAKMALPPVEDGSDR